MPVLLQLRVASSRTTLFHLSEVEMLLLPPAFRTYIGREIDVWYHYRLVQYIALLHAELSGAQIVGRLSLLVVPIQPPSFFLVGRWRKGSPFKGDPDWTAITRWRLPRTPRRRPGRPWRPAAAPAPSARPPGARRRSRGTPRRPRTAAPSCAGRTSASGGRPGPR